MPDEWLRDYLKRNAIGKDIINAIIKHFRVQLQLL